MSGVGIGTVPASGKCDDCGQRINDQTMTVIFMGGKTLIRLHKHCAQGLGEDLSR